MCVICIILQKNYTYSQKFYQLALITIGLLCNIALYYVMAFCIDNIFIILLIWLIIGMYIIIFDK